MRLIIGKRPFSDISPHILRKSAENSLDRVKIKKPEILVYKEVHEFPVFAIFALDKLVIRAF